MIASLGRPATGWRATSKRSDTPISRMRVIISFPIEVLHDVAMNDLRILPTGSVPWRRHLWEQLY